MKTLSFVVPSIVALLLSTCHQTTEPHLPPAGPDTTSHDFVWHIDTLGDGNSSVLYDVAIIDENNIWAVGEIYVNNSGGDFEPPYGFAVWNGHQWELRRMNATGPTGVVSNLRPRGVFAFSKDDIWFASGGVFHWNGSTITAHWINDFPGNPSPLLLPGQTVEHLWGLSASDIYAVGKQGAMAHYNGSRWTRLESGTTVDVNDCWGYTNIHTGLSTVLAPISFVLQSGPMLILRTNSSGVVDTIPWSTGRRAHSVWFQDESMIIASGGGVFVRDSSESWSEVLQLPLIFTRRVRGTSHNNVFIVGDYGFAAHYNGATWHYYTGSTTPTLPDGLWRSLDVREDHLVAVGEFGDKSIVLRGKRP